MGWRKTMWLLYCTLVIRKRVSSSFCKQSPAKNNFAESLTQTFSLYLMTFYWSCYTGTYFSLQRTRGSFQSVMAIFLVPSTTTSNKTPVLFPMFCTSRTVYNSAEASSCLVPLSMFSNKIFSLKQSLFIRGRFVLFWEVNTCPLSLKYSPEEGRFLDDQISPSG